jgi:hypothetical protein
MQESHNRMQLRWTCRFLKIGGVLGTRWVASSFWSVMAVWQDYKALVLHFEESNNDKNSDKKRDALAKLCLEKLHLGRFA